MWYVKLNNTILPTPYQFLVTVWLSAKDCTKR